jgi:hypothetical protein
MRNPRLPQVRAFEVLPSGVRELDVRSAPEDVGPTVDIVR